jgi:hypothetical protein
LAVSHHSQEPPVRKRALPIEQKNMVYNEWAAIIQHQDEMDQALKFQDQ